MRISPAAAVLVVVAEMAFGAAFSPAVAQQCSAAPGGPPCESASGVAGLGDPDGSDLTVGNPFHPITGNKYQEELDAPPLPGFLGLEIRRHFNSSYASAQAPWGKGWALSYDTRLYRSGSSLQIVQADGRRLIFGMPDIVAADAPGVPKVAEAPRAGNVCSSAAPGQGQLFLESYGYRWLWPQQRELIFDLDGRLVQIRPRGASELDAVRIERSTGGRVTRVTDPAGRSMSLEYDSEGHLSRIDHPLGRWDYRIDASGRILSVTSPENVSRRYRYEDIGHPSLITAIGLARGGEAEHLLAGWSYDAQGRAVGYRRADGSGLSMAYQQQDPEEQQRPEQQKARPAGEAKTVSILTNALGGRTWFKAVEIAGRWRVTEIRGPGCEECGPTNIRMRYDRHGQLLARWKIGAGGYAYLRDRHGRVVRVMAVSRLDAASAPGVQSEPARLGPAPYLQRFEYGDEFTSLPRLIARPSVVHGGEHRIVLDRDGRGNIVRLLETGYAPDTTGQRAAESEQIARTFELRYREIAGRRVLVTLDGPLPNGAAGEPSDSDVTRWEYDGEGRFPVRIEAPGGASRVILSRDRGGRPEAFVFNDGHREVEERHLYNLRGQILRTASVGWRLDASGARIANSAVAQQWSRSFDAQGRLELTADAAGRNLRLGRDAVGRLQSITDARGYRRALTRDAEGQVRVAALHEPGTQAALRATYYGRSQEGRLQSLLMPDGRMFRFHYDTAGRWIGFTDPDRLLHLPPTAAPKPQDADSTVVDDFGRALKQVLPDHGSRTMRFDEADRLIGLRDAAGVEITYGYDFANRLISRSVTGVDGGVKERVTYRYEGLLLAAVEDPVQVIRYRRDAVGRVIQTSTALAGLGGPPLEVATFHDPATGLVVGHRLADGRSMRMRNAGAAQGGTPRQSYLLGPFWTAVAGYLQQWLAGPVAEWAIELLPRTPVATDIDVHPFNGLAGFTHGNGSRVRRQFDIAGRTVRLSPGLPDNASAHWRYSYGAGVRIRSIETVIDAKGTGGSSATRVFAYDRSDGSTTVREGTPGDRSDIEGTDREGGGAVSGPAAAFPGGRRPAAPSGAEKDSTGRIVADGRFRYRYTPFGQVEEVRELERNRLVSAYAYNYRGQRIRKTVYSADGSQSFVRFYLWKDAQLAAELAPDGRVVVQYLYLQDARGRGLPLATMQRAGGAVTGRGKLRLLAIHTDHRGAPVAMSDARRRLVWRADVSAAGLAEVHPAREGAEMNLRLPGQYSDLESGLHDNWHRSYDPGSGRYLQPDPLGYPDGPDAYAYAGGDPINRADPFGLYEIDVHYYMTFFLGVTAGLDPQEARIVALAAQYVDDNPLTRPVDGTSLGTTLGSALRNQRQLLGYHFVLSGADGRTLPAYRNDSLTNPDSPQLQNLSAAASSSGIGHEASLQFLGEYLHALADTYSHRDPENIPYDALIAGCGIGHGHALHEPDLTYDEEHDPAQPGEEGQPAARQTWRRESRTLAMELNLHGVLVSYGNPAKARDVSEIEAVLREFNAIRESGHGKASDFRNKIALLQAQLGRLGYGELDLASQSRFRYDVELAARNRRRFLTGPTGEALTEDAYPGVCLEEKGRCNSN